MAGSEVVDIDRDGDVVLICGSGDETKRLRVYSGILVRTSKVFKAMLAPRFKEGSQLEKGYALDIPLPDDDGEAMEIISNIVHLRNDSVPKSLSLGQIKTVAEFADKYDCPEALRRYSELWVRPHLGSSDVEVLRGLCLAAYHFQHAALFAELGTCLTLHSEGVHADRLTVSRYPEALTNTFFALEAHRFGAVLAISAHVENTLRPLATLRQDHRNEITCTCACSASERNTPFLLEQLVSKSLWPVTGLDARPLSSTLRAMNDLSTETASSNVLGLTGSCATTRHLKCVRSFMSTFREFDQAFHGKAALLEAQIPRLCYSCVREGVQVLGSDCKH